MALILLSSLPILPEFIIDKYTGLKSWVPVLGIENLLTDSQGKILGFSTYRVFLYTFFIFFFSQIGWTIWLLLSKKKDYYLALFIPVILGWYQTIIILVNLRKATANSLTIKLYLLGALSILFILAFLQKKKFTFQIVLKWAAIILAGLLPFFHDILTERSGDLRQWVPIIGTEAMLTDANGTVIGFGNYRVFLYTIMLHLYAHLGWLGAYIYYFYPPMRKVRNFLLVPVILSFYSILIIVLNWQETGFNKPDVKFYITIALGVLLAVNYFFNHKKDRELARTNKLEEP